MEIKEVKIPNTRRFNHTNPGECYQCPGCKHVWSIDSGKQGVNFQLNYCPICGIDISGECIDSVIANDIMKFKPKSSILDYGKF